MTTNQGFTTLESIVKDYLLRRGDQTTHNFTKCLKYAIDGLAELNYDVSAFPKTVEIALNTATMSIPFPVDMVDYSKIGICYNGNFYTLGLNEKMCVVQNYNSCGDPVLEQGGSLMGVLNNNYIPNFGYYFYNFGAYGRLYMAGGAWNGLGYYNVDRQNRRFVFNSDISSLVSSVYLEYISTGYEPGVKTEVHAYLHEPLIAFIRWKDIQYKSSVSLGEKETAKREFALARRQYRLRATRPTLAEFYQAIRANYGQGVKA